jgi:hypothetical protein
LPGAGVDTLYDGLALGVTAAHHNHRLGCVADHGDDGGGDVVVDRAHRLRQEAVDERRLALLELADHGDDRGRSRSSAGSDLHVGNKVIPISYK